MQGNFTVDATFDNCIFNNATVEFSGFNSDNTYTARFIDCTFNNIGNTYAIETDNYGMSENCELTLTNCTFNITVASNVSVLKTRHYGNTIKLHLTNNTIKGFNADPNFYKVAPITSLKFYDDTMYQFEVVEEIVRYIRV